jgi:hypothetical protein
MKMILILALMLSGTFANEIYDGLTSDVQKIGNGNWMNQVVKGRQNNNIYIVHFYNENDGKSYGVSKDFKERATELKGIIIFGSVNCNKEKSLCVKEAPKSLPAFKVYPPMPLPPVEFELDLKKALGEATRHIKSYLTELSEENFAGFISSDLGLPKVLLFTDKPGNSMIIRALSNTFNNKMRFGVVRSDKKDITSNYAIKKFPTLIVVKNGVKKPFVFTKEINYKNLFEFLNVFSEQFVPTDSSKASDEKPWLFEAIPELHDKSANDVCTSLDKTLCVIVFSNGKPVAGIIDQLKDLKKNFENNLDRSVGFKLMWLDSSKHSHWNREFDVADNSSLQVRVLNPGRRKRYVKMEGDFSFKSIEKVLEKIVGGDARFINIKADLPAFATDL